MSAARCSDCERNVSLEIGDTEINETTFDDSNYSVEVEIHMPFNCAECETELGEYEGTSDQVVPRLEDYLENHENVDVSVAVVNEAEITETKIITRNGRKTYLAKWATQITLNKKEFKVAGELAITQDQIEVS
jgi:hypothetical protein